MDSVGLKVKTFALAREFVDKAPYDRPACLALDVKMPGLNGLDLQQELHKREYAMPIIFITGQIPHPP